MTVSDPITNEIIRNSFLAVAEEMNNGLVRSAFSPVIYESKDSAVAIIDARHRVLGQSSGIPLFLGNLEHCTKVTEEMFGRDAWQDGDIWIMNDSYISGTHPHDVTVYAPLFYQGDLAGFVASRAHWLDIGGKDPGVAMDSTEIQQEGLRIKPMKIVQGGAERTDVIELIVGNTRFPVSCTGDLRAQFVVAELGRRGLVELYDRYGREVVDTAAEVMFAQSEAQNREGIAKIPDGTYTAEGCLDSDGISGVPVRVEVVIEVAGDSMTIDVTGSDDAVRGPMNCGAVQTVSACRLGFKYLVNPDQPVNGGTFAALDVKVRPGSVLGAQEPSPCQFYFTPLGLLVDLIVKALSPVMPELAAAGHYGDGMILQFSGTDPRTGNRFIENEPHVGGWGGAPHNDGADGMIWAMSGAFKDMPIEVFETKFPATINEYAFRPDTGGAGKYRGGCGVVREYTMLLDDCDLSLWLDRSQTPAWGIEGGSAGAAPDLIINPGRDDERRIMKVNRTRLNRGDTVRLMTGGGGGYGDPAERDPDAVARDVAAGYVTPAAARTIYGYEA
ncbi:hydantoinase B/oxoprolinase family protein [Actinoplanes sp. LDG1-06]|uniref:Hydantoinase B/oxoprolinase family protein n=1 Tax=Paractinoplanes ovalisporus TaxID=2810368 RepID=A0ABS2A778_9ACTN|nr:hydantoinase B/oxoprolinase family protein [Actinoplanes ovalisporus]MBM2615686.1 hydantoinase B/oxoprolinase family protein [Actinoplanes ovalisporus]